LQVQKLSGCLEDATVPGAVLSHVSARPQHATIERNPKRRGLTWGSFSNSLRSKQ